MSVISNKVGERVRRKLLIILEIFWQGDAENKLEHQREDQRPGERDRYGDL